MTKNEFAQLCAECGDIGPSVALECNEVRQALMADLQQKTPESRDAIELALRDNF